MSERELVEKLRGELLHHPITSEGASLLAAADAYLRETAQAGAVRRPDTDCGGEQHFCGPGCKPAPEAVAAPGDTSALTKFDYLLNAMEAAGQADIPAAHGYGDKRLALYAHIRRLEADADRLAAAESRAAELERERQREHDRFVTANNEREDLFDRLNRTLAERNALAAAWRCFHCDETFTDRHLAAQHFGANDGSEVACKIKAGAEGSLLGALRRAEEDAAAAWSAIHNEATDAGKAYHAQTVRHAEQLRVVEELGYERGLADATALTAERDALAERLALAERQRDHWRRENSETGEQKQELAERLAAAQAEIRERDRTVAGAERDRLSALAERNEARGCEERLAERLAAVERERDRLTKRHRDVVNFAHAVSLDLGDGIADAIGYTGAKNGDELIEAVERVVADRDRLAAALAQREGEVAQAYRWASDKIIAWPGTITERDNLYRVIATGPTPPDGEK